MKTRATMKSMVTRPVNPQANNAEVNKSGEGTVKGAVKIIFGLLRIQVGDILSTFQVQYVLLTILPFCIIQITKAETTLSIPLKYTYILYTACLWFVVQELFYLLYSCLFLLTSVEDVFMFLILKKNFLCSISHFSLTESRSFRKLIFIYEQR